MVPVFVKDVNAFFIFLRFMLRFFSSYVLLCAPMNLIIYPHVYGSDYSMVIPYKSTRDPSLRSG